MPNVKPSSSTIHYFVTYNSLSRMEPGLASRTERSRICFAPQSSVSSRARCVRKWRKHCWKVEYNSQTRTSACTPNNWSSSRIRPPQIAQKEWPGTFFSYDQIVTEQSVRPLRQSLHRVFTREREAIKKQVNQMLCDDIIQPSKNPWATLHRL